MFLYSAKKTLRRIPMIKMELVQPSCKYIHDCFNNRL